LRIDQFDLVHSYYFIAMMRVPFLHCEKGEYIVAIGRDVGDKSRLGPVSLKHLGGKIAPKMVKKCTRERRT
jgi:hypothetical protein